MNPEIVSGFVAEMGILDPSAVIATSRYRNPGIGLDSGWSGNQWLGDPPATGRNNFYGGTSSSDPNIGSAYSAMLNTWQNTLSNIQGAYEIKGIIWVQGEQDSKNETSANRYAVNLDNLITRIHSDLGLDPFSVEFYYTTMESNAGGFTYRVDLREQQLAADKDSGDALSIVNANRVDASGLSYTDNVHYTIESRTELGERVANAVISDVTPPTAPTSLAAVAGDSLVSLNWGDNSESDLASYSLYRSTTSSSYETALAIDLSNSEYIDTTAINGTEYFYVVTATDSNGNESAQSSEVSATPATDITAPAAPIGLVAIAGDSSISLDWDNNSESDLGSYSIYRSTTTSSYGAALVTGVSSSDYVDNTAANGTTYYYVVTALDISSNESAQSSEATATPVDTVPVAPTGLAATPGNSTVSLDWDDNSEADIASYTVYRSTTSDSYGSALASGLGTSDYTDNTVTNDITYYYVVTATDNGSSESAQSNEISVTPADNPPSAPIGLGVTPGDGVVNLDWDDNSESDFASYSVYRTTTLGSYGSALAIGLTTSDYIDNTVTNEVTYYYMVTATDDSGNESAPSDELDATPLESTSSYQNDFSTTPTIEDEGSNTSPWINSDIAMPAAGSAKFIDSNFNDITHDGSEMDFSGSSTGWLLINTETWEPGDYTVTFDGRVSSGTMFWDVIGGNASGASLGIRIFMNKSPPEIRAASSGTAERLGQINEAGDTAGSATDSVAAGSFTDTIMATQSLKITLTEAHVGSSNDYIMIGWAGTGSIDDISIIHTTAVTYEEWISSYDLGGLTGFTDDFDNDRIGNGLENYYGTHPGVFSQGLVSGPVTGNTFTFTHPISDSPASSITATYRWSKDLSTSFNADGATADGTTVNFTPGTPVDGMLTVTATVEGISTKEMFVVIEVTEN